MFARRRSFISSCYSRERTGMQYSFLFINFILRLNSVFAFPNHRWQLTGFPGQNYEKGYECGNDIFSDFEIFEAVSMYYQHVNQDLQNPLAHHAPQGYSNVQQYSNVPQEHHSPDDYENFDVLQFLDPKMFDIPPENNIPHQHRNIKRHLTPKSYQGPLYSESESLNYILLPIQKQKTINSPLIYPSDPYYIVIEKNNGEVVDVISKIVNNNYAKCIRIDSSRTELSTSAPDMNDGYRCAHEFLSDELIQASLGSFWERIGKSNLYPVPYVGRLFPPNSGYVIWPIFSRDRLFDYNSVEAGPYFLVLDSQGNLIETLVQGLSNNFLRCTRSRNSSKAPQHNAPNHSSVTATNLESGYYCGMFFFRESDVKKAVKAAKGAYRQKLYVRLPAKYNGPPFYEPLLIWPLMIDGSIYKIGGIGVYRIFLTEKLKFRGVGMLHKSKALLCDKGIYKKDKVHEKSDFLCKDHKLTNLQLENAARKGCGTFDRRRNRFFPAIYHGPRFEKSGPYFTYPIPRDAGYDKEASKDRLVMNVHCEVVWALTAVRSKSRKRFVLCVKAQESFMGKTFIEPEIPIKEYRGRY